MKSPFWRSIPLLLLVAACMVQPARGQSRIAESPSAPKVGEKAPEFTLPDTDGKPVSLADLLKPAAAGDRPWVLLIFYRGYW